MRKTGDWKKFMAMMESANQSIERNAKKELHGVAEKVRSSMVTGITTERFEFAPNAPSTIEKKGSSTPLVDDGDLVGSIDTHDMDAGKLSAIVTR